MTEIPVLVPPPSGVLSQPYVTPAMFRAFPTFLDVDNLVPGGIEAVQDDVLWDVLLQASDWAVGVLEEMPLHGHWVQGEALRTRAGNGGRLYLRPRHIPLRAITALSYGHDPSALTALSLPCPSMWVEDGREVSFAPYGGLSFAGPAIQFGAGPGQGAQAYVQWSYLAGYPSTTLAAAAAAGATSVTVADPASILPGDVLRVYDPAGSEALTVSAAYAPALPAVPAAVTTIPLAGAVQNPHVASTGITGMPRRALQSVIAFGVALLMREDVSEEEPASPFGPAARTTAGGRGGQASGLVNDAYGWLQSFKPTLRP